MKVSAIACSNIALVKYWGKRDTLLNLPQNSSISLTLDGMTTHTTVEFDRSLKDDEVMFNGERKTDPALTTFLDLIRRRAGFQHGAYVMTTNNFPTAAGLASSASGYAALALAASRSAGLDLSPVECSILARQGSGSASRSIFGGYVEWQRGEQLDGLDSHAVQLAPESHWDLRMLVVILTEEAKAIGSRAGMNRTVDTSPFYAGWLSSIEADLVTVRGAIADCNFDVLGQTAEANCLKMHATMLGSIPPVFYWSDATVRLMRSVWELRANGLPCYFTIDAGPNVKVLVRPEQLDQVLQSLQNLPGVQRVLTCSPGAGARLTGDHLF